MKVSIRRVVGWGLVLWMVPAGLACLGGERDTPEWDLTSGKAPSGSSSGTASSSGTGGSTSSGTGGSTSSGTGGSTSSGTGGSGGSVASCDGTNDCGGCVTCATDGICKPLWDDCQNDVDCAAEAECELQCALGAGSDVDAFNTCVASLCTVPGGFDQVWPCFCTQSCEADCAASALFHCVLFMP